NRQGFENDASILNMMNQTASLVQMGSLVDVSDDLQNIWGASVTPDVALVYWYGAERGRLRVTSKKVDGRRFAQRVMASTVKSLPALQKTFTVPDGVSYERVPLSLSDKKMLSVPRFQTDTATGNARL